jgi:acetolactate synthase I/III small subunit
MSGKTMRTFVVYVRRTPEILARVVLLFHRRAIEIERLTAEREEGSDVLRMTVNVEADSEQTQRIEANLYKLLDVLHVDCGNQS